MTKKEGRSLINQKAGSQLNVFEIGLLSQLLSATFTHKDPNKDIEECSAAISIATLADRIGVSDRTVKRYLHSLETKHKLITVRRTGRQSNYTLMLAPMKEKEWEMTRTVRQRRRAEQSAEEQFMRRFRRSLQAREVEAGDEYSELVNYAQIERSQEAHK